MSLALLQKDVAKILNVSEDCVTYWENKRSHPTVQQYPRIVTFLGYNPLTFDTGTLTGRIKEFRYMHGLSHKKLGKLIGVDGSTLSEIEGSRRQPSKGTLQKLTQYMEAATN